MAKNDNLNDFLLDLADVIRTKTGTTELINPQDFSTMVSEIRSVIEKPVQYVVAPSGHTLIPDLLSVATYIKIITDSGVIIGPPMYVSDMLENMSYKYLAFEIDFNRIIVENLAETSIESLIEMDNAITTITKDVFDSIGTSIVFSFVDLGLPSGTFWADKNIGATKIEEKGLFYHWGGRYGTKSESFYNLNDPLYNNTTKRFTRYNPEDGLSVLQSGDDAVYLKDSICQLPSPEDYQELFDNTTITSENVNGVVGLKFTSNINGKSIFFPNCGYAWNHNNLNTDCSYLWTNKCNPDSPNYQNAYNVLLRYKNLSAELNMNNDRKRGCCIRPIQRIKTE